MDITTMDIDDLKPFEKNPKKHPEDQINVLKKSMQEFGWTNPILIAADNMVVAGHARLQAAKELKFTEVPVIKLDMPYEKAVAYVITDNRVAELAETDDELMTELLREVVDIPDFDFEATGYTMDDLDELIASTMPPAEIVEDEPPEPPEEPVTVRGDVWELGRHRLMCGDSTVKDDVEKLMGGVKADMVFTDPPYNADYKSRGTDEKLKSGILNDNMSDTQFHCFVDDIVLQVSNNTKPGGCVYLCCNWKDSYPRFYFSCVDNGINVSNCIVWNKGSGGMGWQDYRYQFEFIIYGFKLGAGHMYNGGRDQTDVWEMKRENTSSYIHPTQKPIDIPARAIKNSSNNGQYVLDLFGGSGSTLIACEQTNRINYSMELDPHYCDVIIQRYVNFTGNNQIIRNGEPYTWEEKED